MPCGQQAGCQSLILSQVDLVKDGGQQYFVQQLGAEDSSITPESRAQSAFVLAVICDGHPRGQALCADAQLLAVALAHLRGARAAAAAPGPSRSAATLLLKWLCLAIGKLCEDMPEVRSAHRRDWHWWPHAQMFRSRSRLRRLMIQWCIRQGVNGSPWHRR